MNNNQSNITTVYPSSDFWNRSSPNYPDVGNPRGIISDEFMQYSTRIVYVGMTGCVGFFGIVFNIVNILVFWKQGFGDGVNASLFALSISDLCISLATFVQSICYNIWVNDLVTYINFRHVQYFVGAWPRGIFVRVSSFITAYISFERCLCIMLPLKVKAILTRGVTLSVIGFIYVSMLSGLIIVYLSLNLTWQFSQELNRSVLSLSYRNGQESKDLEADYILVLSLYQFVSFVLVVILTITLIVKMRSKNKWREKTLTSGQLASMTTRDIKVMKTVLLISVTFIVCYIPSVSQLTAMYSVPGYGLTGDQANMYIFIWSLGVLGDVTCATVNIFFYYTMSSKFKAILHQAVPQSVKSKLGWIKPDPETSK